jgi:hypothetical protein
MNSFQLELGLQGKFDPPFEERVPQEAFSLLDLTDDAFE